MAMKRKKVLAREGDAVTAKRAKKLPDSEGGKQLDKFLTLFESDENNFIAGESPSPSTVDNCCK